MSFWIDKKYVSLLGSHIDRLTEKKDNTWACRCPYCKDSKKNKYKTRGYFFWSDDAAKILYKCHNCGFSTDLQNVIRDHAPSLESDYKFERFTDETGSNSKANVSSEPTLTPRTQTQKYEPNLLENYETLANLDDSHPAKQYILDRKIPIAALDRLYWTEDFREIAGKMDEKYLETVRENEARLIIPMYDAQGYLFAISGRSIDPNEKLRYVTAKRADRKDHDKYYGLERYDPKIKGYVTEGQFDSEFLPNCIALSGISRLRRKNILFNPANTTVVWDNQPRNRDVCRIYQGAVDSGFWVCIWPKNWEHGDINDAIKAGVSPEDLKKTIDENTFTGLKARLKLQDWKSVSV